MSALTFAVTSLVFPVSTTWGTYLHAAGAAHVLLILACLLALDAGIARLARRRGWSRPVAWLGPAFALFGSVVFSVVLLGAFGRGSVDERDRWRAIEQVLPAAGIALGPGSPTGEAYLAVQDYLLELKRRGVLLAVCSKNNPDDARLPFIEHPDTRLRLTDFAAFFANWSDKAENLRAIAAQLNVGLDSLVFLDDNPVERAWVRSQLPDVTVVELGATPFGYGGRRVPIEVQKAQFQLTTPA